MACDSLDCFHAVILFDLPFNLGRDGVAGSARPRGNTGERHPWRKGDLLSVEADAQQFNK